MLVRAVQTGKADEVKRLIDNKANLNERDTHKQTALHIAAQFGKTEIFQLLIVRKRLDVNAQDEHGWTALHWAANKSRYEFCQALLAHKSIRPFVANDDYNTPFLYLCRGRVEEQNLSAHMKLLANFVARGVDINEKNRYGETPLHYAVISGNYETAEFLCQQKCNVNALNNRGETPINYAVRSNRANITKLLLNYGADTTITAHDGIPLENLSTNTQVISLVTETQNVQYLVEKKMKVLTDINEQIINQTEKLELMRNRIRDRKAELQALGWGLTNGPYDLSITDSTVIEPEETNSSTGEPPVITVSSDTHQNSSADDIPPISELPDAVTSALDTPESGASSPVGVVSTPISTPSQTRTRMRRMTGSSVTSPTHSSNFAHNGNSNRNTVLLQSQQGTPNHPPGTPDHIAQHQKQKHFESRLQVYGKVTQQLFLARTEPWACCMKRIDCESPSHANLIYQELQGVEDLLLDSKSFLKIIQLQQTSQPAVQVFVPYPSMTLADYLRQYKYLHDGGLLSATAITQYATEIAIGLQTLHEAHLVHRSLHTSHIYVFMQANDTVDRLVLAPYFVSRRDVNWRVSPSNLDYYDPCYSISHEVRSSALHGNQNPSLFVTSSIPRRSLPAQVDDRMVSSISTTTATTTTSSQTSHNTTADAVRSNTSPSVSSSNPLMSMTFSTSGSTATPSTSLTSASMMGAGLQGTTSNPFLYASDIWSFGMVLFELLTLSVPYTECASRDQMIEVMKTQRPSLPSAFTHHSSSSRFQAYENLVDLFQLCTHSDPSQRPVVSEIVKALTSGVNIKELYGFRCSTEGPSVLKDWANSNARSFTILSSLQASQRLVTSPSPLLRTSERFIIESTSSGPTVGDELSSPSLESAPSSPSSSSLTSDCYIQYSDLNIAYFKNNMANVPHEHYFGESDDHALVVIVSIELEGISMRQGSEPNAPTQWYYKAIVRSFEEDYRIVLVCDSPKERLKALKQHPLLADFRLQPTKDPAQMTLSLLNFEALQLEATKYKFGVIYRKRGQTTDDEMLSNDAPSPSFTRFLEFLGERIQLQGWQHFRGGLDTTNNTTGTHAVFTRLHEFEVLFHVSTLLPFDSNPQQLHRKRHIGNDVVVVIFQDEDADPFSPDGFASHFNHVFVVIQPHPPPPPSGSSPSSSNIPYYQIGITYKNSITERPRPFLKEPCIHPADETLHEFLITKMINSERVSMRSDQFEKRLRHVRKQLVNSLLEEAQQEKKKKNK